MDDLSKSKAQLIQEVQALRSQVASLRASVSTYARQKDWQAAQARYSRFSRALCSSLALDETLPILLEEIRDWLDATTVSVWLLDAESKDLVCREVIGPQDHIWRGWHTDLGESLAGSVLRSGERRIIPDAQAEVQYNRALDYKTGLISRSLLLLPLCAQGEVAGVLWVMDTEPDCFSAADLAILEPVAMMIALLVQDLHLHDRVVRASAVEVRLLEEVNHRVRSNLSVIVGLLYAARHQTVVDQATFIQVMDELIGRVQSIAIAHNMLSTSGWGPVLLSELTQQVAFSALRSVPGQPLLSVHVEKSSLRVTSHVARSLALIINELVSKTLKQVSSSDQVVHIHIGFLQKGDVLQLGFCGAKACRSEEILLSDNFNSNLKLVRDIVRENLRGTVIIQNEETPGVFITFDFQQSGDAYEAK